MRCDLRLIAIARPSPGDDVRSDAVDRALDRLRRSCARLRLRIISLDAAETDAVADRFEPLDRCGGQDQADRFLGVKRLLQHQAVRKATLGVDLRRECEGAGAPQQLPAPPCATNVSRHAAESTEMGHRLSTRMGPPTIANPITSAGHSVSRWSIHRTRRKHQRDQQDAQDRDDGTGSLNCLCPCKRTRRPSPAQRRREPLRSAALHSDRQVRSLLHRSALAFRGSVPALPGHSSRRRMRSLRDCVLVDRPVGQEGFDRLSRPVQRPGSRSHGWIEPRIVTAAGYVSDDAVAVREDVHAADPGVTEGRVGPAARAFAHHPKPRTTSEKIGSTT